MTDLAREDVERLVRIEAKLDDALTRSAEDRGEHDRDIRDVRLEIGTTEQRVGSLENWRYAIVAALLMGASGTVAAAINAVPK
ncbi:hypothetical protein OG562_20215 [Streptomyces sp. NBC_01275]|uniref:hypothetical protein n=1 Tax=Streptomyces sp. NBC_01275 TaxID=2903807 RepID=UPI00224DF1D0|nr:hypothetical protein [Streptomyces sp. NBC_01275]MCX4763251.1 hypothetical protein [Streptomyces sp. NBC_01275]